MTERFPALKERIMRLSRWSLLGGSSVRAGFSLVEIAMVMLVMSLALVPVVQNINGARSSTGLGSADRVTSVKSKETLIANSLLEQALSDDFRNFDCDAAGNVRAFNPVSDFPAPGASRVYNRCTNRTYNNPVYYQWSLTSIPGMPAQNEYYQAVLNVYGQPTGGVPLLTLPMNFFRNTGAFPATKSRIGVMVALDVSGSMVWAQNDYSLYGSTSLNYISAPSGLSSPYLFYRYEDARYTGANSWPVTFNLAGTKLGRALRKNVNSELDMSLAQAIRPPVAPDFTDPVPTTQNNEKFPYSNPSFNDAIWGKGLLGTGDCSTAAGLTNTADPNTVYSFVPQVRNTNVLDFYAYIYSAWRTAITNLCSVKTSDANWNNVLNANMSRIEAARTGILSLLLNLEQSPTVVDNVDLGFVPWNDEVDTDNLLPLQAAVTGAYTGKRFAVARDKFLWVNRADPKSPNSANPIYAGGSTNIYKGLEAARAELKKNDYGQRIIVLLTDGEPSPANGQNTKTGLRNYTANTIGKNAADSEKITLFTIGLIGADETLMKDMAENTPNGQGYAAGDISQLNGIFESISYQIQKLALIGTTKRYGLEL